MNRRLLDTHTLIWLMESTPDLGKSSQKMIEEASEKESVIISVISFWEIAMLREKKRIQIAQPIRSWRRTILDLGIKEIPLSGDIAINSVTLENFHQDPADRMIVATALTQSATLITADKKILNWSGKLQRHDACK